VQVLLLQVLLVLLVLLQHAVDPLAPPWTEGLKPFCSWHLPPQALDRRPPWCAGRCWPCCCCYSLCLCLCMCQLLVLLQLGEPCPPLCCCRGC
jgi:hypothetical protein